MKDFYLLSLVILGLFLVGCGGEKSSQEKPVTTAKSENPNGLSDFEMKHGIGPITEELVLNEVDLKMAERGAGIFEMFCSACHEKTDRYIGPPLGDILDKRSPTYVMNMILNPDGMVKDHPDAKALLAEYLAPMPNQNLSEEDARAIVEYLNSDLD